MVEERDEWQASGFNIMRMSLLAEKLVPPQKGLCSMKLVS